VPSVPTTSDKREKYLAAAIVVWSVPPFPSPRRWTLPAVEEVQTDTGRPGADIGLLHEPLTVPPFVLLEQDATELGQRVRPRIVECPEDALSIGDRERDDCGFLRERLLEKRARRFVDEPYELADVLVGDPQTGEIHNDVGTP
jgi:hypothetical protein